MEFDIWGLIRKAYMLEYSSISLKEKTKKTHRFPRIEGGKGKKKSQSTQLTKRSLCESDLLSAIIDKDTHQCLFQPNQKKVFRNKLQTKKQTPKMKIFRCISI